MCSRERSGIQVGFQPLSGPVRFQLGGRYDLLHLDIGSSAVAGETIYTPDLKYKQNEFLILLIAHRVKRF